MAVARVPGEFFFAEQFEPFESMDVYSDELGVGIFMFCWQTDTAMSPTCLQFLIQESDLHKLLDDKVDIWVAPKDKA